MCRANCDRRYFVSNFPLGALAHLGLARAYAEQGDAAKVRVAYQDFFALWKDADPDIPILRQGGVRQARVTPKNLKNGLGEPVGLSVDDKSAYRTSGFRKSDPRKIRSHNFVV